VQQTYYSWNAGTSTLTRNASFGTPTSSYGPRIVQLAAKVIF